MGLFKDMLGMIYFTPSSQLQEGYLLLQLSPDYLQKEIPVRFYFVFWKWHKDLFSLPVKGGNAVSYPLSVTDLKSSSNSQPGVN